MTRKYMLQLYENCSYFTCQQGHTKDKRQFCDRVERGVEETSNEISLQKNRIKTEIMLIDRQNNNRPEGKRISDIGKVDDFIYIGTTISSNNGSTADIERRSSIAK